MNYSKEKIEAYLGNKMSQQERIDFEKEIQSDKHLGQQVELALKEIEIREEQNDESDDFITDNFKFSALRGKSRKRNLSDSMNCGFSETHDEGHNKTVIRLSILTGIGLIILIFLIFQINFTEPQSTEQEPEIVSDTRWTNDLDYYMDSHKYEKALLVIDSLEKELLLTYSKSAMGKKNDSLSNELNDEKKRTQMQLYELTWDKINVLLSLDEYYKATFILSEYKDKNGPHKKEAQSLWQELKEK